MFIYKKKGLFLYILLGIILLLMMGFLVYARSKSNVVTVFSPMVRDVESKRIAYRTRQYQSTITENFIIRYDKGIDNEVVDLVVKTAEDKYRRAVKIFNYKPSEKILVILYDDVEDLNRNTMLKKGSPPMGVYYGDSIHLLNPRLWVKDEEDLERSFYSEGPLLHELAHLFTDHIAKGNFPMWFTEGISLYLEYEVDGYQWGKEVDLGREEYTLEMLTNKFDELDEYLAYTQSFRIVKGFAESQGIESLMDVIRALGEGKDMQRFMHLF